MFSRLFTLALMFLVDLPVDAAPVLNSAQDRMEETRKEHEEALKTYRELAQKEPETYLPEVGSAPWASGADLAVRSREPSCTERAGKAPSPMPA